MSFARPDLLWLALALPLLIAAALYGYTRRRRRAAQQLGDPQLLERLGLAGLGRFPARRAGLLLLAAAALGIAAAGPRWGIEVRETRGRALNVVLALDVSKSMLTPDLAPNRLERARLFARRLLRELAGDRMGVVVFAGRAYILSPLTVDHSALELFVDALDPEIVSTGGSSLAAALRQATDLVQGDRRTGGDRAVVLITDGEALEDEQAVRAEAERARKLDVIVHTVGVGTRSGEPVPELQAGQIVGYKRNVDGAVVVSRLNEELLRAVADETRGRYVRLADAGATSNILDAVRRMRRSVTAGGREVEQREQFAWFVGIALLALALDALLERRAGGRRAPATVAEPREAA